MLCKYSGFQATNATIDVKKKKKKTTKNMKFIWFQLSLQYSTVNTYFAGKFILIIAQQL